MLENTYSSHIASHMLEFSESKPAAAGVYTIVEGISRFSLRATTLDVAVYITRFCGIRTPRCYTIQHEIYIQSERSILELGEGRKSLERGRRTSQSEVRASRNKI